MMLIFHIFYLILNKILYYNVYDLIIIQVFVFVICFVYLLVLIYFLIQDFYYEHLKLNKYVLIHLDGIVNKFNVFNNDDTY